MSSTPLMDTSSGGGGEYELPCEVGLNYPTSSNPNTWDPYPNSTSWNPMKQCLNPLYCF